MRIIPLHLERRFEQRWAARFGSLVIPAVPKNVGLKGSPVNMRRARQKPKNPPGWVGDCTLIFINVDLYKCRLLRRP
jgi:hypothetical protein